jgi:ADP-ribosylglycohydrolase
MTHEPNDPHDLLRWELAQRRESGYDVGALLGEAVIAARDDLNGQAAIQLLDDLELTSRDSHWDSAEPERLSDILASVNGESGQATASLTGLDDRILGAWLGRCAGNTLGKPVENGDHWSDAHLRDYLQRADAYPLTDFVPVLDPMPVGFELRESWPETTLGRVAGASRDDDLDYTILGLHVLETYGRDFTTEDVAREWLDRLPFTQTYTAERVVYRNLVAGIPTELARDVRNPYREWIGAQIRADIFGYVNPGDPKTAATMAFRDARLSHTANGVYGAMWAAALISLSFVADGPRAVVEDSLGYVPPQSRLHAALRMVLDQHASGLTWEQANEAIHAHLGHYSWVHTINNAAVVAAGLLWGDGDVTRTLGLTVQAGWDTDSNGATAGSAVGALVGAGAIPSHWVTPLDDTVRSALRGFDGSSIQDLAARTADLARAAELPAPAGSPTSTPFGGLHDQ